LNSDRVHISFNDVPMETHLFKTFNEDGVNDIETAKQLAIGYAVTKAIKLNGESVSVAIK
jgi:hypothetical protein